VIRLGLEKGETPVPENGSVDGERVVRLGDGRPRSHVREGKF